jgi:DNA invertase Pin-like site-specific DNA recombinase
MTRNHRAAERTVPAIEPGTVSLYVRLSKEADATNLSRDGMLADLRALAERQGLRIVAEHLDDGISGARRDRPAFRAWLDDALSGRASALAAWHVDRMTREGTNAAALILDVVEGKDPDSGRVVRPPVRLLDVAGLDSQGDPEGFRWRFVIGAEVARAERARMVARSKARVARLKSEGRFTGGPAPYGTHAVANPDGAGRVLVVEPSEAEALREALRRLRSGDSPARVARWMTEHGPTPRRAAEWKRMTLLQALQSEAASRLVFDATERREIREIFEVKKPRDYYARKPARLLSGVVRCFGCGATLTLFHRPLTAKEREKKARPYVAYRCQSRGRGGTCPGAIAVRAELVEAGVSDLWLEGWGRLREKVAVRVADENAERLACAEDAVEVAESAMRALRGDERRAALERLEVLEAERDALAVVPASALSFLRDTGRTYADAWNAAVMDEPDPEADPVGHAKYRRGVEERRDLLLATVGRLTVGPGARGRRGFDLDRMLDAWRLDPASPEWTDEEAVVARTTRGRRDCGARHASGVSRNSPAGPVLPRDRFRR